MRVVFMGTPGFAVPSLLALAATHQVVAVYTMPDRPAGRGREPKASAVKEAALGLGIPVVQPRTLRDSIAASELESLKPDVVCVAAYGLILPQPVLDIPRFGCVNVHASLLPRWRGAAPIQRAILAGDETTGVSIMRMEAGLDTGPYAAMLETSVDGHTAETLTSLLGILGARALLDVLAALESDGVTWVSQDEAATTYADKVSKADVALEPSLPVLDAWRRVRASTPQAPSRLLIAGTPLTIVAAAPAEEPLARGAVLATKRALLIGLADGALALEQVTPQGRKTMEGAAYARGAALGADAAWSAIPSEAE